MQPNIAPYGSWKSPITSDLIASKVIGFRQIAIENNDVYWIETRPTEQGRNVLVKKDLNGHISDVTPHPFNVRTLAHEYGGGDFVVAENNVFFSNFSDQYLYKQSGNTAPIAITKEDSARYADLIFDPFRKTIICVCEKHFADKITPENCLISIDTENNYACRILASGADFYSSPKLSPDGKKLTWLTWNHPDMPWDSTQLWIADIEDNGLLTNHKCIAGGQKESIFQPEWSPDNILYFVSDRTGWWNLYRWNNRQVEPLYALNAEFGEPQWVFGLSTYGFESSEQIICTYNINNVYHLARLDITKHTIEPIDIPYSTISSLKIKNNQAIFIAGSPTTMPEVVKLDLKTKQLETLRYSTTLEIDPEYISIPEAIEFSTEEGLTAHAFFYAPKNKNYKAPSDEKPPLLVKSHGGPTAATSSILKLGIQYWTSRGIGVLDVNYGGSTGYGREYRHRLKNKWGIVDVDDCVNGAQFLAKRGDVDPNKLLIDGGSAGGYTTLCALVFRNVFRAGASHYGVSDLEALVTETHKFESRYLDNLIGPYPGRLDLYKQRSPIYFAEKLNCPIIFFQGLEDKVVPPNQAEIMVNILRSKGLPVAYITFEKEQHGFRQAENIKFALDAELYFYSKILGFELADYIHPINIENL